MAVSGAGGDGALREAADVPIADRGASPWSGTTASTPPRHGRRRTALLCLGLGVPFLLFLALAEDIAERDVLSWDTQILRWAADRRTPQLDGLMQVVTDLGATLAVVTIALALAAFLLHRRLRREALFVVLSTGSAALLNVLLKQLFQRPRPDIVTPVVSAHGFAFPSGHTMSSMALACSVTFLCWHLHWRWRWPVSIATLALAFAIGTSRIYLGVHYPSDVLAGWLVSLDLVAVVYLLLFRRPGSKPTPRAGPDTTARAGPETTARAGPAGPTHARPHTDTGGDHGDQA